MNYSQNNVNLWVGPDNELHTRWNVTFQFTSHGYFAQCPYGHFIMVMRKSGDLTWDAQGNPVSTIRGQGVLFGNVSLAPNGCPVVPGSQIETLFKGLAEPGMYLMTAPAGNPPQIQDGVPYTVQMLSFMSADRTMQWVRYLIWQTGGAKIYDSDWVIDPNKWFDPASNILWVGHVFGNPGTWDVSITNVLVAAV